MATTSNDELSQKYQQKTDKEHILANPDTYIGSVENVEADMWLFNKDSQKIIQKSVQYIPGLYKLFDEGIVNCRDHVVRMKQAIKDKKADSLPVSYIDIGIQDDGTITMTNDGNGIDVAMHPEYNIWIPELIFGHLRTSTNYNKNEKKIVGGKNGFGFKLVLIWSTEGSIETVDHVRGLKYTQTFSNNLDTINKPKVTKCKNKPYTKITFKPDYSRFGVDGLTPDMVNILIKRIYDVAAVTEKNIKVKYNSQQVSVKTFQQYIDMYVGSKDETPRVFEDAENGRWEYAVALSPTHEFQQVSYVNGIHTSKGGKHVDYILQQITRKLSSYIEKKKKIKNTISRKEAIVYFTLFTIPFLGFAFVSHHHGYNYLIYHAYTKEFAIIFFIFGLCYLTHSKEIVKNNFIGNILMFFLIALPIIAYGKEFSSKLHNSFSHESTSVYEQEQDFGPSKFSKSLQLISSDSNSSLDICLFLCAGDQADHSLRTPLRSLSLHFAKGNLIHCPTLNSSSPLNVYCLIDPVLAGDSSFFQSVVDKFPLSAKSSRLDALTLKVELNALNR